MYTGASILDSIYNFSFILQRLLNEEDNLKTPLEHAAIPGIAKFIFKLMDKCQSVDETNALIALSIVQYILISKSSVQQILSKSPHLILGIKFVFFNILYR